MIQNYRLSHFNQLMKPTSIKLETNKDFVLLFGMSLKSTMKKSDILITSLYSNRTENELSNINEIHDRFRTSIANILFEQSHNSINSYSEEDYRLAGPQTHMRKVSGDSKLIRKCLVVFE
jgi:hypothetical protein